MSANFEILIASDPQREKVYAEIYCKNKFVALVSQENGPEHLQLEFADCGLDLDQEQILRSVDLDGFLKAVDAAVSRLSGKGAGG